jgi:hypothetical protein
MVLVTKAHEIPIDAITVSYKEILVWSLLLVDTLRYPNLISHPIIYLFIRFCASFHNIYLSITYTTAWGH